MYIGILALIRESLRQQIVIDLDLQEENRPVLASLLTQGSLTLAGVIRVLSEHGGNLVMVNPELEKIVNHRRDQYIQEHDLIEMLDGTRMGKATSSEQHLLRKTECLVPFWQSARLLPEGTVWRELWSPASLLHIPR